MYIYVCMYVGMYMYVCMYVCIRVLRAEAGLESVTIMIIITKIT